MSRWLWAVSRFNKKGLVLTILVQAPILVANCGSILSDKLMPEMSRFLGWLSPEGFRIAQSPVWPVPKSEPLRVGSRGNALVLEVSGTPLTGTYFYVITLERELRVRRVPDIRMPWETLAGSLLKEEERFLSVGFVFLKRGRPLGIVALDKAIWSETDWRKIGQAEILCLLYFEAYPMVFHHWYQWDASDLSLTVEFPERVSIDATVRRRAHKIFGN